MLYNYIISVIVYFKFPAIIFYIFVLGSNYLPLYHVYLARVGHKG